MLFRSIIAEIQDRQSILDLAVKLGFEIKENSTGATANCPGCDDDKGHLYLYSETNTYHCFRCKISGDMCNLISIAKNMANTDAVRGLLEVYGYTDTNSGRKPLRMAARNSKPKTISNDDYSDIYAGFFELLAMPENVRAYLHLRAISDKAIERFHLSGIESFDQARQILGQLCGSFTVDRLLSSGLVKVNDAGTRYLIFGQASVIYPHFKDGRIIYLSNRFIDPQPGMPKALNLPKRKFWNVSALDEYKTIYIFEGVLNAISYWQLSKHSNQIATIGIISKTNLHQLTETYPDTKFILAYDPDEAGELATEKLNIDYIDWLSYAKRFGFNEIPKKANGKICDINDYLVHLHQLTEELIGCYGMTEDDALVAALKHFQDSTKERKA